MSTFGDKDPEDAYDASDPVDQRLALVVRILSSIADERDVIRAERRRIDVLRILTNIAEELGDGE